MKYIKYKTRYYNRLILIFIVFSSLLLSPSCKKFLDIPPPKRELVTETVFENTTTATAAMTVIYSQMAHNSITYDIPFYTGLYGDELQNRSTNTFVIPYYTNELDGVTYVPSLWAEAYKYIYQSNAVWEGCSKSSTLDLKVKKQLMAEAQFMRAFWYFYLVNLYGDVPLITSTDYTINSKISRTPKDQVYQQIIDDLKDAQANLNNGYVDNTDTVLTSERVRPNQSAATALLARTYLYLGKYTEAEANASIVINNISFYDTVPLSEVFLKNNKEAIWQIPPSSSATTYNTKEGLNFILTARPDNSTISERLLTAFEEGDKRKESWINSLTVDAETFFFPYKYKVKESSIITEYSTTLRLAEQYLIRAEARAQQGKVQEAQADLNIIRHRAGLPNTTATSKEALMTAILNERRIELFSEWGHRWFDLKRVGEVNNVMEEIAPIKGSMWASYKQLWPIPQTDITNNPNLKQNPNYN